jgi:hypothetical protein
MANAHGMLVKKERKKDEKERKKGISIENILPPLVLVSLFGFSPFCCSPFLLAILSIVIL